jgi:hypothetical protein
MKEIATAKSTGRDSKAWVYAATIKGEAIEDQSIWKLTTYREMAVLHGQLKIEVQGDRLTVSSDTFCGGVHVPEVSGIELSDNYFDLLPAVPHTVRIVKAPKGGDYTLEVAVPLSHHQPL